MCHQRCLCVPERRLQARNFYEVCDAPCRVWSDGSDNDRGRPSGLDGARRMAATAAGRAFVMVAPATSPVRARRGKPQPDVSSATAATSAGRAWSDGG